MPDTHLIALEDVLNLAQLARLELNEQDAVAFAPQLEQIVGFFDQLRVLDLTAVTAATPSPVSSSVLREDCVAPLTPLDEILGNAPVREGDCFSVPRIIDAN